MATIEELQEQIAALIARVDALTVPPNRYYSSRYTGETIDKLLTSISGGAADLELSNLTDYQRALHNIGGRPNKNFAPNWYFAGGGSQLGYGIFPINQKGKTEYSTDHDYGIDGWKSAGGYKIPKNGLLINTGGIAYAKLDPNKIAPLIGETCTASILYANGNLISGTFLYASIDAQNTIKDDSELGFWIGHVDGFGLNYPTITINQKTEMGEIVAVKLELGDKQTLCYKDSSNKWNLFETPDFGETLARCQQDLLMGPLLGVPVMTLPGGYGFFVATPQTMRTNPAVIGTPIVYKFSGIDDTGNEVTVSHFNTVLEKNGVYIYVAGEFDGVTLCRLLLPAGTGLSAEL